MLYGTRARLCQEGRLNFLGHTTKMKMSSSDKLYV